MMKKLIFAVALMGPALISAQGFEGIIKFSMEYKGDQADMMAKMAPTANIVTIKGNKSKVVMEGGMMSSMVGDVINIGDEKTTYFVQSATKTAYKVKSDEMKDNENADKAKVTKESSTATILGYKCQKYKVEIDGNTNYVWATKEIDAGTADYRGKVAYKGIEGVIMKHEMNVSQQGSKITIIMTMVAFEKKSVKDDEFEIPSNYTVKEEMPEILKMQMGQ
jgi:hypothetical protein